MVRISNILIGIINICSIILSLAAIVASVYFHAKGGTECQKIIRNPLLILGVCLFLLSLLGLIGSCGKVNWVMYIYLAVMFLLIIGVVVFTILAFFVTNENAGKAVSGRGQKDLYHWLPKQIKDEESWKRIRSCLVDGNVCKSLKNDGSKTAEDLYKKLSLVQSTCCKPPRYCGYEFKNATFWNFPKSGLASQDPDCTTYNNDQTKLCYDCESCKAGLLASIRSEWRTLAIFNSCVLVFLIIVYSVGCCARRNNAANKRFFYRYRNQV